MDLVPTGAIDQAVDVPGALTVTAGLALLVYALVDAVNAGWGTTATLAKIAAALLLLSVFIVIWIVDTT